MTRKLWGCVVLAALSMTVAGCDGPRQPWRHQLVSVTADGTDAGGVVGSQSVMSADGTKVAFVSLASDLGATDTNGALDVYVRDLTTATTTLVSVDAAGTDAGNGRSTTPAISADGTRVAFLSEADDLGPTDTNQGADVYVRDLSAGTTTLVSVNAAGTDASTGAIFSAPVISPDGTKVVFQTSGADLGPNDTLVTCLGSIRPVTFVPCPDTYLRDLTAGTTELLTVNAAGTNGADYGVADFQAAAVFSADSSKVALVSTARDLVSPLVCCGSHVYVRDLATDTTVLAPAVLPATDDLGVASDPAFSPDGSQVVFQSTAPNPSGLYRQVVLHDLGTGDTTLVSADSTGTGPGGGSSENATFGPDGRHIYFQSVATDLVPEAPPGPAIYRWAIDDASTTLVVADAKAPAVSTDGRFLGFVAPGGAHGPTDTNDSDDVYRLDMLSGTTTLVSTNGEGTDASGSTAFDRFQMTADGHRFLFESRAGDLGPRDTNGTTDSYVADLGGADLALDGTAVAGPVGTPQRLVYSLEVVNHGPEAAEATKVALVLPEGAELASAPGGCTEESRVVVCEVGTLAAGSSATVTIRVDAGPHVSATDAIAASDTIEVDGADNTRRLSPTIS